jgi:hypothetical protein
MGSHGFRVIIPELVPAGNGMLGKTKIVRKSGKGGRRAKEWNMIVLTWVMDKKERLEEVGRAIGKG